MVNRRQLGLDVKQEGDDFQLEVANAWKAVTGAWRMRIRDGGNGERPADEIVLLDKFRILSEIKSTKATSVNVTNLIEDCQVRGLLGFEQMNKHNVGVVIIKFRSYDTYVVVRMRCIVDFIKHIQQLSLSYELFETKLIPCMIFKHRLNFVNFENNIMELYV